MTTTTHPHDDPHSADPPDRGRADGGGGSNVLTWVRWGSIAVIAVCLLLIVRALPVKEATAALETWVASLGPWGPVAFGAVYVAASLLFVPAAALTLAAGAVFGIVVGTITVFVAATTAAVLAFLIARYLARPAVERHAAKLDKFRAVDRAVGEGGGRVVALLRLSPLIPFSVGNYLFGLTAVRLLPYALACAAMLPGTLAYVYLGHTARAAVEGGERGPLEWTLLGVGLLATVAATAYLTRLARKRLKEKTDMNEPAPQGGNDDPPRRGRPWATLALAAVAALAVVGVFFRGALAEQAKRLAGGPPAVEMKEAHADDAGGGTFDHSAFDALLERHVDADGGVDYAGFKADAAKLDEYLAAVAAAPFDALGRDEKLALLINAYNAATIRLILDHGSPASIMDIPSEQRWDAAKWVIGGRTYSLNQIEHEQVRPKFAEPRVHFALVCAAVGCPPLRAEAYAGDRLEAQLASQAEYVHAHDRWFQYQPGGDVVKLTKLYDWYGGDFEQSADGSVLAFAARYAPALKAALDGGEKPDVKYLDYSWALNTSANVAAAR